MRGLDGCHTAFHGFQDTTQLPMTKDLLVMYFQPVTPRQGFLTSTAQFIQVSPHIVDT